MHKYTTNTLPIRGGMPILIIVVGFLVEYIKSISSNRPFSDGVPLKKGNIYIVNPTCEL